MIIFSTKNRYNGTNYIIPLVIYVIGMVLFFYQFPHVLKSPVGYVITFGVMSLFIYPFTRSMQIKKSYIEIYEDHIEGVSIPDKNNSMSCTFNLEYEQISNIEIQTGILKIYFSGGSYLVQAKDCEEKVVSYIKERQMKYRR